MKVILHLDCGQPAFALRDPTHVPVPGDVVLASDYQHLDGRPVLEGEPMICDSCRHWIGHDLDIRLIRDWPASYEK